MQDEIAKALRRFLKERGTKRGFLLTGTGAYFLYDGRFCSICEYQLRLKSPGCDLNTNVIDTPLFLGVVEKDLRYAAVPRHPLSVEYLRLLFHVACGTESDELLRGLLISKSKEARFALFSDPTIEEMFLTAEAVDRSPSVIFDQETVELLQQYARNDLRLLVELYLQGRELKNQADTLYDG